MFHFVLFALIHVLLRYNSALFHLVLATRRTVYPVFGFAEEYPQRGRTITATKIHKIDEEYAMFRYKICFVENLLNNKTIILLNLANIV